MRYVAAYLLCALGGKTPSAKDVKKVLESVGIEVEDDKVNKVVSELAGKDVNEVIAAGAEKLASVPSGGVAASAGGGGGAPAGDAAPAEEKKEEKPAESEESDDDMGFGLFD